MGAANFLLDTFYLNRVISVLKDTGNEWVEDKAPTLGAAIAYYTVVPLAPLILLLISVFSLFVHNNGEVRTRIRDQVAQFAGGSAGDVVNQIIDTNSKQKKSGIIGTVVAVVVVQVPGDGVRAGVVAGGGQSGAQFDDELHHGGVQALGWVCGLRERGWNASVPSAR